MRRRPYRFALAHTDQQLPRVYFRAVREQRAKTAYMETRKILTPQEVEVVREWMRSCDRDGVDPFKVVERCPTSRFVHIPGLICQSCEPERRARVLAEDGADLDA